MDQVAKMLHEETEDELCKPIAAVRTSPRSSPSNLVAGGASQGECTFVCALSVVNRSRY